MKRLAITATAGIAIAVLAGCGSSPNAHNLAWGIPGVHGTSASECEIPPTPLTADHACVHGSGGLDIVATFHTNGDRAKWAQAMAGSDVNSYRIDGTHWTMLTTDKAGYRAAAAAGSKDLAEAVSALHGKRVPIGSSE